MKSAQLFSEVDRSILVAVRCSETPTSKRLQGFLVCGVKRLKLNSSPQDASMSGITVLWLAAQLMMLGNFESMRLWTHAVFLQTAHHNVQPAT